MWKLSRAWTTLAMRGFKCDQVGSVLSVMAAVRRSYIVMSKSELISAHRCAQACTEACDWCALADASKRSEPCREGEGLHLQEP